MTVQRITDLKMPIGDILRTAAQDGVLLESGEQARYALIPLDDDLIDYLIERSPTFAEECRQIRDQMHAGRFRTHEEVKKLLADQ